METAISTSKLNAFRADLSSSTLAIPAEKLSQAFDFLAANDFPTTRHEDWKYTRLARIANLKFEPQSNTISQETTKICGNSLRFVFVDGTLTEKPSTLPTGLVCKNIQECNADELQNISANSTIFESLNLAYAKTGIYLQLASKTVLDQAIEIVQINTANSFLAIRNFIDVASFSQAEIILNYPSAEANNSFVNAVSDVFVGKNAHLKIYKIQSEKGSNYHVSRENVLQEADSNFTISTITINSHFVRNDINVQVNGQNSETNLFGAYLLKENQHVDNHTVIDHKVANCLSNELYKGVIYDKGTAVFNGKVFVRKDAQKINAFQSNANVLMSDDASVNSKPELEIYADDVKCSHGSTTGQLDEEAVFYLRARGIGEQSARNLVVSAFVNDALEKIENEEVLNYIYGLIQKDFGWEI